MPRGPFQPNHVPGQTKVLRPVSGKSLTAQLIAIKQDDGDSGEVVIAIEVENLEPDLRLARATAIVRYGTGATIQREIDLPAVIGVAAQDIIISGSVPPLNIAPTPAEVRITAFAGRGLRPSTYRPTMTRYFLNLAPGASTNIDVPSGAEDVIVYRAPAAANGLTLAFNTGAIDNTNVGEVTLGAGVDMFDSIPIPRRCLPAVPGAGGRLVITNLAASPNAINGSVVFGIAL